MPDSTKPTPKSNDEPVKAPKLPKVAKVKELKPPKAAKPTKPPKAPPPPPPEGSVAAALAAIADPADDEDVATYTAKLASESNKTQVTFNLARIKLGLTLAKLEPKAREGRTEWQAAESKRLGIQPRQLRTVLSAAKAMRLLAAQVPVAVLDRPLAKVAVAAKAIKKGQDPDAAPTKLPKVAKSADEVVDAAIKKLEVVIEGLPEADRLPLINRVSMAMNVLGAAATPI